MESAERELIAALAQQLDFDVAEPTFPAEMSPGGGYHAPCKSKLSAGTFIIRDVLAFGSAPLPHLQMYVTLRNCFGQDFFGGIFDTPITEAQVANDDALLERYRTLNAKAIRGMLQLVRNNPCNAEQLFHPKIAHTVDVD